MDELNLRYVSHGHRHMAHWLVAKTAREMADQLYEEMARDNAFRKRHPRRKAWVDWVYGSLLAQARAALGAILADQRTTISQEMKDKIADALIQDASLRRTKDNRVLA